MKNGGGSKADEAMQDTDFVTGIGVCGWILFGISWLLVFVTLPFSLCVLLKVVQEYERAVIFRLGRLLPGGAKGPGIFFVLPCIEAYQKVDLRTITLGVPPQEVLTRDSVTRARTSCRTSGGSARGAAAPRRSPSSVNATRRRGSPRRAPRPCGSGSRGRPGSRR